MKRNDHYIVKTKAGHEIYRCTTGTLSEEVVIKELYRMFEGHKKEYRVYKNDLLIHRINNITSDLRITKGILDKETGIIYKDCYDLADQLGCSYIQAKTKVRKQFRYKLIKKNIF